MRQQHARRHGNTSPLSALRSLVPRRPLAYQESLRIAELQAQLLLDLAQVKGPPVPTDALSLLPRTKVVYLDDSPIAASAHWDGRDWIIVVNGRQREPRRRHSLAHELKHVIDHTTRSFLYTGTPRVTPPEQTERAADYFADCLLMPFAWLRHASSSGCQTANEYASRFVVPVGAAKKRLNQVGLAPRDSRQLPLLPSDSSPNTHLDIEAIGAEA